MGETDGSGDRDQRKIWRRTDKWPYSATKSGTRKQAICSGSSRGAWLSSGNSLERLNPAPASVFRSLPSVSVLVQLVAPQRGFPIFAILHRTILHRTRNGFGKLTTACRPSAVVTRGHLTKLTTHGRRVRPVPLTLSIAFSIVLSLLFPLTDSPTTLSRRGMRWRYRPCLQKTHQLAWPSVVLAFVMAMKLLVKGFARTVLPSVRRTDRPKPYGQSFT